MWHQCMEGRNRASKESQAGVFEAIKRKKERISLEVKKMANEKRLIDAVRFREALERYYNAPHVTMFNNYSKGMRIAIETCVELLDAQRTIDAVEVVHGRWIEKQEMLSWCEDDVDVFWECSLCECQNGVGLSPYCPNCGAKMDGERKDKDA